MTLTYHPPLYPFIQTHCFIIFKWSLQLTFPAKRHKYRKLFRDEAVENPTGEFDSSEEIFKLGIFYKFALLFLNTCVVLRIFRNFLVTVAQLKR